MSRRLLTVLTALAVLAAVASVVLPATGFTATVLNGPWICDGGRPCWATSVSVILPNEDRVAVLLVGPGAPGISRAPANSPSNVVR